MLSCRTPIRRSTERDMTPFYTLELRKNGTGRNLVRYGCRRPVCFSIRTKCESLQWRVFARTNISSNKRVSYHLNRAVSHRLPKLFEHLILQKCRLPENNCNDTSNFCTRQSDAENIFVLQSVEPRLHIGSISIIIAFYRPVCVPEGIRFLRALSTVVFAGIRHGRRIAEAVANSGQ